MNASRYDYKCAIKTKQIYNKSVTRLSLAAIKIFYQITGFIKFFVQRLIANVASAFSFQAGHLTAKGQFLPNVKL